MVPAESPTYIPKDSGANDLELMFAGSGAATLTLTNPGLVGFETSSVPEPATLSILAIGGVVLLRRRRK